MKGDETPRLSSVGEVQSTTARFVKTFTRTQAKIESRFMRDVICDDPKRRLSWNWKSTEPCDRRNQQQRTWVWGNE